MRHVNDHDLARLQQLLEQLRKLDGLRERRRGTFTRCSQAFLHFHADGDELFADVRLTNGFERYPVTTTSERRALHEAIQGAINSTGPR